LLLFVNSLAHFLVDGLCVATLFGCAGGTELMGAMLLYNSLAFSTQCITGLITDAVGHWTKLSMLSIVAVVLGFLLPVHWGLKVGLVGLGNSLFHVCGGTLTLMESDAKAWKLGVFVAPGAFGVTIGTLWPEAGIFFAFALMLCALELGIISLHRKDSPRKLKEINSKNRKFPILAIILLTLAVAVRAVGGSAVSFPWKTTAAASIIMTAFVFLGKAGGGMLCDRIGAQMSALISIVPSALLIAFCSASMPLSLAGQLLLNLSMPVTLYLMYKAMPESPGFAFGLAASALWPGTIAGQLFTLTGPALYICVIISFVFGLVAIIYSARRLNYEKVH